MRKSMLKATAFTAQFISTQREKFPIAPVISMFFSIL